MQETRNNCSRILKEIHFSNIRSRKNVSCIASNIICIQNTKLNQLYATTKKRKKKLHQSKLKQGLNFKAEWRDSRPKFRNPAEKNREGGRLPP